MNWIKKYWTELIIAACTLLSIFSVGLYFFNFSDKGLSGDQGHWGTFGDYIGGILGTVLSFFSVILIYATYKNQVSTTLLQQFETTFFNLLQNQREIMKSLNGSFTTYNSGPNYVSAETRPEYGEDYIITMKGKIAERMETIDLTVTKSTTDHLKIINDVYDRNYSDREAELAHYFRHLYHIFKYAHESKLTDKKKYIDIIQAQMSNEELYITFYNGLSKYGYDRFFPLLDHYQFFENIGSTGKIFDEHAKLFYKNTQFKFPSDGK